MAMARVYDWNRRTYREVALVDLGARAQPLPRDLHPAIVAECQWAPNYAAHVELDRRIIAYVRAHPGSTRQEIARGCGVALTQMFVEAVQELCQSNGAPSGARKAWTLKPDWDCGEVA